MPDINTNQIYKSKGVKVISILYFLAAVYNLGAAMIWLILGLSTIAILYEGFFNTLKIIGLYSAIGILCLSLGVGLWRYRNWARLLTIFLTSAGIILFLVFILIGRIDVPSNIILIIFSAIIGSYLTFSSKVKIAFKNN